MTNIQSTLLAAPIRVKIFHSQCYLVATAIHRVSTQSDMCIYTYYSQHRDSGRAREREREREKSKRILSIFNDESTESFICLWKLAVAVATYVSICIVYRVLPSFAFNGINVDIGHTCNTMRVYHATIIKCATLDSFCFLFIV
jgi:hypothetical protein